MKKTYYARYQTNNGFRHVVMDDCQNGVYADLESQGITEDAHWIAGITYGELDEGGHILREWDFGLPCPAYQGLVR